MVGKKKPKKKKEQNAMKRIRRKKIRKITGKGEEVCESVKSDRHKSIKELMEKKHSFQREK